MLLTEALRAARWQVLRGPAYDRSLEYLAHIYRLVAPKCVWSRCVCEREREGGRGGREREWVRERRVSGCVCVCVHEADRVSGTDFFSVLVGGWVGGCG